MTAKRPKKAQPGASSPTVVRVETKQVLQEATGSEDRNLQEKLLDQACRALWLPDGLGSEEREKRILGAVKLLQGIRPQDEIEGMLAVQMTATHDAALECLRRAMLPEQTFAGRDQNLKHGTKLLGIFAQQMAALNKHRGKGQQKVTVEYVNVESGGQAIVGHVEHGRSPKRKKKQANSNERLLNAPSSGRNRPRKLTGTDAHEPAKQRDDED